MACSMPLRCEEPRAKHRPNILPVPAPVALHGVHDICVGKWTAVAAVREIVPLFHLAPLGALRPGICQPVHHMPVSVECLCRLGHDRETPTGVRVAART